MRATRAGLAIIALALCVLCLALLSCEKEKRLQRGIAPIDFELKDINGATVRLQDYRGKVVLLEFWAIWCPPCKLFVPELNELHKKLAGTDAAILSIAVSSDKGPLMELVKAEGVAYPVLIDDKGVDGQYGVNSIPTIFILDKEGKIFKRHVGYAPGIGESFMEDIKKFK